MLNFNHILLFLKFFSTSNYFKTIIKNLNWYCINFLFHKTLPKSSLHISGISVLGFIKWAILETEREIVSSFRIFQYTGDFMKKVLLATCALRDR